MKARSSSAVELAERAVELLRAAPARVHLLHLAGSAPFALALLVFVVDCSLGAGARHGLAPWSAALAALYLAMKAAHAGHARGLREVALGAPAAGGGTSAPVDAVAAQLRLQPWSLWLVPLAAIATLPFGWVYAYFQTLVAVGDGRRAARLARLWPRQNHGVILLVSLCGLVAFANLLAAVFAAPFLVRALFGVETAATVAPAALFNATTLGAAAVLAFLAVSPLTRALYVLRSLDGEARASGEDLRAALARAKAARAAARAVVLVAAFLAGAPAQADAATDARVAELDRALDRELASTDYVWREDPRWELDGDSSWIAAFWEATIRGVRFVLDAVGELIERIGRWLSRRDRGAGGFDLSAGAGSVDPWRVLALLAATTAAVAAFVLLRQRRRRATVVAAAPAPPVATTVDLADHDAGRLPSEEWLRLATELERASEFRAAARAVHLASLSCLARGGYLRLAAAKTNRDYERELDRRARSRPELVVAWNASVAGLEPVWYGEHAADARLVRELRDRLGEIARHAPAA